MQNFKQTQQLKQQLRLAPNQILVQKLLLLPVTSMEQRIKEEIENNPALEDIKDKLDEEKEEDEIPSLEEDTGAENIPGSSSEKEDDFDASEFMEDDDEYVPAYKLAAGNYSSDEEVRESSFAGSTSFQDSLHFQLGLRNLNERQFMLAEYIIGNIDDDGYLRSDLYSISNDITFYQNISAKESELSPLLKIIQEFDPPGVGARNLQECLLIQLKRLKQSYPPIALAGRKGMLLERERTINLAIIILEKGFNEFSKKNYDKLKLLVNTGEEEIRAAINEIVKLNPKPGQAYTDASANAIPVVPDFIIANMDSKPEAVLNGRISQNLRLNPLYVNMAERKKGMDKMQREAASFARTKTDAAGSFIHAIQQREDTLQKVMQAILNYQGNYFISGDEQQLKPMLLKDIAKITGLDVSTISRVVSNKYIQTDFGTFLLKTLFSESFEKESGETVSINEVKNIIQEIIQNEDKKKPVNDEGIMAMLDQKGYKVARRTVAKYRESMEIPVARMRKEI